MQTTSNTWKTLVAQEGSRIETKAIINGVEYTEISPPVISRALMQDGVSVGNVVSAVCTFSLETTDSIPKSAEVQIKMRITDGAETNPVVSEWLPAGTYFISRRTTDPLYDVVTFECYDALLKANSAVPTDFPQIDNNGDIMTDGNGDVITFTPTYPCNMEDMVSYILPLLGLELDSRTILLTGANYVITQPSEGTTIRDILSTIAACNGGNWIITPENKLRLVPVVSADEADEAEDIVEVEAVVGDISVGKEETITGIRVTVDTDTAIIGDETGALVDVSITPLIAADLAETMVGIKLRPYALKGAFYDPAIELGDFVKYNTQVSSILNAEEITLGVNGNISSPDPTELADEYPYIGVSNKTLALAKAYVQNAVEEFDDDLTQQEIFNRLTNNGVAQGLVLLNGQLYVNATYLRSGTIDGNQINAKYLSIIDDNGNVISDFRNVIRLGGLTKVHSILSNSAFSIVKPDSTEIFTTGPATNGTTNITETISDSYPGQYEFETTYNIISINSVTINDTVLSDDEYTFSGNTITTVNSYALPRCIVDYITDETAYYFSLGIRKPNTQIGMCSVAEGFNNEASGAYSHAESYNNDASGDYSHAEGGYTLSSGDYSHSEGYKTEASGKYSHAEGNDTNATSLYAHAEGSNTTASGAGSHAEGQLSKATASSSHAEGYYTKASGSDSHAEGYYSEATGDHSHAENRYAAASGSYSHAEGNVTTASGACSHAEGDHTLATGDYQHVSGKYNEQNATMAEIVGNGTGDNNRSNARTLDWYGNETLAGSLTLAGTLELRNAIAYTGTKATYDMIRFIDNTNDAYGNGISIGGGGATIIGGGESAGTAAAQVTTGGSEILYLCNDGDVNIFSNVQNGWNDRKTFTFNASGNLVVPSGCRIGESGGALYLGNSGNQSWVYVQDMASQSGADKWKIQQNGNATFAGTVTAGAFSGPLTGNVTGNCSGSSGSCTGNAASATKTKCARINENANLHPGKNTFIVSEFNPSSANLPSSHWYYLYKAQGDDTAYSVQLALGETTSALYYRVCQNNSWPGWSQIVTNSGTWGISITGNAANVTGTVAVGHGGTGATPAGWTALNNIGLKVTDVKVVLGSQTWTRSASGMYYDAGHSISGASKVLAVSVQYYEQIRASDHIFGCINTNTSFRVNSNVNSFASATASNVTFRVLYV